MIRIAITPAAYRAICSTLPEDAPLWPVQRQGRPNASSTSRRPSSTRLRAMRRPGESYSDVSPEGSSKSAC